MKTNNNFFYKDARHLFAHLRKCDIKHHHGIAHAEGLLHWRLCFARCSLKARVLKEESGYFLHTHKKKVRKLANSVAKRSQSMTKLRRSGSMDFGNASVANVLDVAKALCLACKQRSKPKRSFSLFQVKVGAISLYLQKTNLGGWANCTFKCTFITQYNTFCGYIEK